MVANGHSHWKPMAFRYRLLGGEIQVTTNIRRLGNGESASPRNRPSCRMRASPAPPLSGARHPGFRFVDSVARSAPCHRRRDLPLQRRPDLCAPMCCPCRDTSFARCHKGNRGGRVDSRAAPGTDRTHHWRPYRLVTVEHTNSVWPVASVELLGDFL